LWRCATKLTWTVALSAALAAGACRERPDPAAVAKRSTAWHRLGSWSGRDNRQTESFNSESGALRVRWETRGEPAPGAGVFRVTAHSAISGRLLQEVVDQRGPGRGIGYVQQDPHVFYFVVESKNLDWEFTVEEAIAYP
jgi:hypothetical protein